jgi:arginase
MRNRLVGAPIQPIQVPIAHGAVRLGVEAGARLIDQALRAHLTERQIADVLSRIRESAVIPHPPLETPLLERAPGRVLYPSHIGRVSREISTRVRQSIAGGYLALILGGDHTVAIGSIAGAAAEANRLAILWIDAHPDLNWPEVSPSGHAHGMALAAALGRGHEEFTAFCGRRPRVQPSDAYLIGVRSIDPGERVWLAESPIWCATMTSIDATGIDSLLSGVVKRIQESGADAVHVSFDVDVVDPLVLPGTGTPEWGGFTFREVARLLRALRHSDLPIRSLDWAELNPMLDQGGASLSVATELLAIALGEEPL